MRLIDITQRVDEVSPAYPGDASLSIERTAQEPALVSAFRMSSHLGTHVDAPSHLHRKGDVCDIDCSRLIGTCQLVHIPKMSGPISPRDFPNISEKILLIRTGFVAGDVWKSSFAYLTVESVQWLVSQGVDVIGIDTPSIDSGDSHELASHICAIDAGILILENLCLTNVEPANYQLIALPLKIKGLEASPVRAVLLK